MQRMNFYRRCVGEDYKDPFRRRKHLTKVGLAQFDGAVSSAGPSAGKRPGLRAGAAEAD